MMDSQRINADENNIIKSEEMRKKVKNAESSALKRYKIEQYVLEDLGKVLNDVYCSFQPVPADYDARKDLVKDLNAMAKDIYGNSEESSLVLEVYGSFVMDMFSRHSDLDVSINFGNETSELSRDEKLEILSRFAEKLSSLEGQGFVRNVVTIFNARVPIVKFFDQRAAVECDLSVDNKCGILNSEIIRIISQIDGRFQKLCVLVKQWAKEHEVNSALSGTLNSLSITLLVALHLQTQKPPILPPFSTLFRDGMDPPKVEERTENFLNWGQCNTESLGRLFATFFIKLQSVKFLWRKGLCVSVLNGLWIYKNISQKPKKVGLGSICVEDFTDVSQNFARAVSKNGIEKIYSSINRTIEAIIRFLNGKVSETCFRLRLFGQQDVVERHSPVPSLNGEIAGTHIKHNLFSQQAAMEPLPPVHSLDGKIVGTHFKHNLINQQAVAQPPPPVPSVNGKIIGTHQNSLYSHQAVVEPPLHNGNGTETDRRDRLFGKQAVMEPPPRLPSLNDRMAGTHPNHILFGQPSVVEPPPPVPRFNDNIAGTQLRHGMFGQPAAMENTLPLPQSDDKIAGTHLRHGLFGQPAAMERPPPVPMFDDKIVGTHLRHGLFGQPAAMERPPPVPQFNDKIVGTHLKHGSFGRPVAMDRPPPVTSLNVYPQQRRIESTTSARKTMFMNHKDTPNYNRYSQVCNKMPRDGDVGAMLVTRDGKLQTRKINQSVFREMVAKCIIKHDLPFSYVEYDRVRSIWKYLNADVKFISRNTAAADVFKFYENEKSKLKVELSEITSRISFTSDLWSAITVEGYICLTAHYIDKHWKLRNKILAFCAIAPPHTGIDLAMKIIEVWKEWGIERKVFSLTLDNASDNDSMQNILKRQLVIQNDLLCGGEFFHVRCSAHILNLIVQEGLKVMSDVLGKIRDSIKYVEASEARGKLFASCVDSVGINLKDGLTLDVPTRWNSTFKMLDRAIKYRFAFDSYQGLDPSYKFLPTGTEWKLGMQICELLQPFDEITNLISGSTYPTSNLYFMQVYKIEYWLKAHENSEEDVIIKIVEVMKRKFDKYWHDYSLILAMMAVFDPRFKLSLIEYCFTNLDKSTSEQKVEHVKEKLKLLFKVYSKPVAKSSSSPGENLQISVAGKGFINCDDFHNFRKKKKYFSGKSTLDRYLEEPLVDMEMFASLNVLDYWKDNSHRFGELSRMACDLLSIPITTVASESSFSIGSRVLNKYRSCFLPRNVQALICARNWLRGFEPYDNESDVAKSHEEDDNLLPLESFASTS